MVEAAQPQSEAPARTEIQAEAPPESAPTVEAQRVADAPPEEVKKSQAQVPQSAPAGSAEKTVQAERRRWPRLDVRRNKMVVAWQSGTERQVSYVASVGINGLFVLTKASPPTGTQVKLLIETPAGDVRARAIVRRVIPGEGMGLSYVSMDYTDRARLYQLFKSVVK
jgi:hypothetical protein